MIILHCPEDICNTTIQVLSNIEVTNSKAKKLYDLGLGYTLEKCVNLLKNKINN